MLWRVGFKGDIYSIYFTFIDDRLWFGERFFGKLEHSPE